MNDDELIELSQAGSRDALEAILVRYKPLVYKTSRPYYVVGGDDDDVIQEGLIGLYNAVMNFDKTKFPIFKVFAGVCIKRHILSAVKKASRLKHNPLNTYVSLSADDSDPSNNSDMDAVLDGSSEQNPENILIQKENVSGLEDRINSTLSSFEAQVLLCVLNGHTYRETAQMLNRDAKAVDNAMQRIKKKLDAVINNKGE